jgi:branched-chain amino acid aminotransferase
LRPTGISTGTTLGVRAAEDAKIFCVGAPVGPYYPAGFKPISLYCDH